MERKLEKTSQVDCRKIHFACFFLDTLILDVAVLESMAIKANWLFSHFYLSCIPGGVNILG